jgi:hypothetical protein
MTSRETVVNKALTGSEVKELLRRDFERQLASEGLLSEYISYGRVSWDIRLRLHMTNWMNPESESVLPSRPIATNLVDTDPALAAVEAPPLSLSPGEESIVSASELTHSIDSPNLERVNSGMPIPVMVKQHDGTVSEQKVTYPEPPDGTPAPDITIQDQSAEARQDWKLGDPQ